MTNKFRIKAKIEVFQGNNVYTFAADNPELTLELVLRTIENLKFGIEDQFKIKKI